MGFRVERDDAADARLAVDETPREGADDGARQEISLAYLPETKIGDYVLVHVGFAMTQLDTDEAERILREIRELEAG